MWRIMIARARLGQLASICWVLALAACSGTDKPDALVRDGSAGDTGADGAGGPVLHFDDPMFSTGSLCPQDRSLTYESFARGFFASYCTRCHGSDKVGMTARNGAPGDHNFDSLAGVQRWLPQIDMMAAAGPKAAHMDMPLDPPNPSDEQRQRLGAWLACREGL
jgi:hypothetical protein